MKRTTHSVLVLLTMFIALMLVGCGGGADFALPIASADDPAVITPPADSTPYWSKQPEWSAFGAGGYGHPTALNGRVYVPNDHGMASAYFVEQLGPVISQMLAIWIDGNYTQFSHPSAVATDGAYLYLADNGADCIYRIDPSDPRGENTVLVDLGTDTSISDIVYHDGVLRVLYLNETQAQLYVRSYYNPEDFSDFDEFRVTSGLSLEVIQGWIAVGDIADGSELAFYNPLTGKHTMSILMLEKPLLTDLEVIDNRYLVAASHQAGEILVYDFPSAPVVGDYSEVGRYRLPGVNGVCVDESGNLFATTRDDDFVHFFPRLK